LLQCHSPQSQSAPGTGSAAQTPSRFIRENREKAIEVLMQWARVDRDQAVAAYDSDVRVLNSHGTIPDDGLQLVIEQASKEARITKEFSAPDVSRSDDLAASATRAGYKRALAERVGSG
jgi:hypothetical protein